MRPLAQAWARALVVALCLSCQVPVEVQRPVADSVALTANAASKRLTEQYGEELLEAVRGAVNRQDSQRRRAEVERRWSEVWVALDWIQFIHGRWADLLDDGDPAFDEFKGLRQAYCELRAAALSVGVPFPAGGCDE